MNHKFLAGCAFRNIMPMPNMLNQNTMKTGSPLQVKALALSLDTENIILVAIDSIYVLTHQSNFIRNQLSTVINVPVERIIIAASHTHSAPVLESVENLPYFEYVTRMSAEAAAEAWKSRKPARFGYTVTHVSGASFNTNVPLPNGGVKFTRDYREGLASGRCVDPRLTVIRVDDETGKPIAGLVCFAAHPACVIFDAPISAEYPGYMTDAISASAAADGAPVLFGYGASGDVNCIPMFGSESDSRNLGLQLAQIAAPVFADIKTNIPIALRFGAKTLDLPLDSSPSIKTLDQEIAEISSFIDALDSDPTLEWVLGVNCWKHWSVERKKWHVQPLLEWSQNCREFLVSGGKLPSTWPCEYAVLIIDDLGLVFYDGEPLTQLSLTLAARSTLKHTLLLSLCNGSNGYLGMDEDRHRGGYRTFTDTRCAKLARDRRPLPYALGAADCFFQDCLSLMKRLDPLKSR